MSLSGHILGIGFFDQKHPAGGGTDFIILGDGKSLHPDDVLARDEDGPASALGDWNTLGPEDFRQFFSSRRAQRPVDVPGTQRPDGQRKDETSVFT